MYIETVYCYYIYSKVLIFTTISKRNMSIISSKLLVIDFRYHWNLGFLTICSTHNQLYILFCSKETLLRILSKQLIFRTFVSYIRGMETTRKLGNANPGLPNSSCNPTETHRSSLLAKLINVAVESDRQVRSLFGISRWSTARGIRRFWCFGIHY